MKQRIFTLVMMLALVLVAGRVFAAVGDKWNPYPGSTWTYNLPYVLINGGEITLNSTSTDISVPSATTPAGLTLAGAVVGQAAASSSISIPIKFDENATGTKKLTISVKDLISGCTNTIFLDIPVAPKPAITLSVLASGDAEICQNVELSPTSGNAAAVLNGVIENTFTFTVTPVVSNVTAGDQFSYEYNITLPTNAVLKDFAVADGSGKLSGTKVSYSNVTAIATDVFTVTFKTTTGKAAQTIEAEILDSKLTVGTGVFTGTITPLLSGKDDVKVKEMPSIGAFN